MSARVLFVVTEDWYFCSHRLGLARAVREAGYEVSVATRVARHGDRIRAAGIGLVPIGLRRRGRDPAGELRALGELVRVYDRVRPDLVHHVALKPVLYGSVAARRAGVRAVVNALAGLGFVFASDDPRARRLRAPLRWALRRVLDRPGGAALVQNPDDRALLASLGVRPGRIALVRGSGVDPGALGPLPEPPGPPVALFVGRLLREKGVLELVDAARRLRARGSPVRVRLVGDVDPGNPGSLREPELRRLTGEGVVEWLGPVEDVAREWARAHLAVLPSYREGLPRTLLEAAACARALVATDVPGCREVVREGETGLLVPPRDPGALAAAIERLAGDRSLRRRLGAGARRLVEAELSEQRVFAQTLALYRALGVEP